MFIFMSQEKIHLFSRESQFGHLVYVEKRGVAINEPLKAFTDSLKKNIEGFSLEFYLSISQNKGKNTNEKAQH